MDKVISFGKGIRRQPSIGDAGELSELVNLIPKNGELVNVKPMVSIDNSITNEGDVVIATHKVGSKTNIIAKKTNGEIYVVGGEPIMSVSGYKSVAIVGNTICVCHSGGISYAIYKDGIYNPINLSDEPFSIRIQGEAIKGKFEKKLYSSDYLSLESSTLDENQIREMFLSADSMIESFCEKQDKPDECFKYVTLGIAALRAYDGSYISYSNIFTLDPASQYYGLYTQMYKTSAHHVLAVKELACKYKAFLTHEFSDAEIDLIGGVDIFLSNSTPFIDFSNGMSIKYESFGFFENKSLGGICDEISEMIFTKSVSIEIGKFSNAIPLVRPKGEGLDLSNINSHIYSPAIAFPYNGRLNISNIDVKHCDVKYENLKQIPQGIIDTSFESYGYYGVASDAYNNDLSFNSGKTCRCVIEVDIKDPDFGLVTNKTNSITMPYPLPPILSYPSMYAERMRVYICLDTTVNNASFYKEYTMHPMAYGNMSIAVSYSGEITYTQVYNVDLEVSDGNVTSVTKSLADGWTGITIGHFWDVESAASNYDKYIGSRGNILKYSPSGNPFVFPALNTVSVGTEEIKGVSTSAKALSQGQFGQFPLYAFCTDGIWALEVASDGSYSAKQPISRDVCNNADSITQVDGAVAFTTDQGLKLIQGSEVVLLSGQMDGHNVNESNYFPEGFFAGYGHEKYDKLVTPPVTDDFRTILATSKIAYDYPNRLLRIYPNSGKKWYVYSLEAQEFSSEEPLDGGVKAVVAGFPTSLIQVGGGLYTFRNEVSDDMRDGLLLTRPIDMGEPFAMKKLHDMRTLYTKHSDSTFVRVVVFVSNDGVHWAVLPSLRRGSFKYYRLAMITRMTDADRLSGTVMRYTVERNNKLR